MIKIDVFFHSVKWKNYLTDPEKYIKQKVQKFNKKDKNFKKKIISCTLLLSESKEIKKLNKKFRNKNKVTDVLSFPFYKKNELKKIIKKEKLIYLGDIIINLNKIKKKNKDYFKLEFNKLWIHGLAHLFGHDHKRNKDFNLMNKFEQKFLSYIK